MPELDGFELAQMLREHPRYEKTAIIFISAIHLSDVDRIRGYETGAVDYVPVPVIPEILRAKVKIFVELYRKTRQLERAQRRARAARRRAHRRARGVDRAAARERGAPAPRQRGGGLRHLRLQGCLPARCTGRPICAGSWASAGEDPLTLEKALAVRPPRSPRDGPRSTSPATRRIGDRREIEFKIVRPDGEMRWLLDRGQAMPDGQDRSPAGAWSARSSTSPSASRPRSGSAC